MQTLRQYMLLGLVLAIVPLSVHAVETVKSPVVEKGELEIEYKGKYQHDQARARDDEKEYEIALSFGVTERWKPEMEFEFDQKRGSDTRYKKFKFENTYQITSEQDDAFADFALFADVAFADRSDTTHDYSFGFLASKDFFGKTTNTANLLLKQDFGDTAANGVNVIYRWQTKYNYSRFFEPGFEVLGDTRKKDAFRDQSLRIGPAVYGAFPVGSVGSKIGYEMGYLFGVTPATSDGMLKWKLEYEIYF